jgi:hypothetical protein
VFNLRSRRVPAQEPPAAPTLHLPEYVPPGAVGMTPDATLSPWSHIWAMAQWLNEPCCRVLVSASTPALRRADEPYIPPSAFHAQVAHWLASPEVGLLASERAGYVTCFQPTPLGREVVTAFLADYLYQRADHDGALPGAVSPDDQALQRGSGHAGWPVWTGGHRRVG